MNRLLLIAKWHDVRDLLPNGLEYKIVRCINKETNIDFYFMAYFDNDENEWHFFDDEYTNRMQVTHWLNPPKINELIEFNLEEDKNE